MARRLTQEYVVKDKGSRIVRNATTKINSDLKRVQSTSTKASTAMAAGWKRVIGILGVAGMGAAFVGLIRNTINYADELGKLNARLGINITQFDKLRQVADVSGVSFQTLTMATQRMTRRIAEAAEGTGVAVSALDALGISVDSLSRMSPDQQFLTIAEALSKVETSGERVSLAFKLFDSEGVRVLQMLPNLKNGLEGINSNFTPDKVRRIEEFNDKMTKMRDKLMQLAIEVLPSLNTALDFLINNFKLIAAVGGTIVGIKLVTWISAIINSAAALTITIWGSVKALKAFLSLWKKMVGASGIGMGTRMMADFSAQTKGATSSVITLTKSLRVLLRVLGAVGATATAIWLLIEALKALENIMGEDFIESMNEAAEVMERAGIESDDLVIDLERLREVLDEIGKEREAEKTIERLAETMKKAQGLKLDETLKRERMTPGSELAESASFESVEDFVKMAEEADQRLAQKLQESLARSQAAMQQQEQLHVQLNQRLKDLEIERLESEGEMFRAEVKRVINHYAELQKLAHGNAEALKLIEEALGKELELIRDKYRKINEEKEKEKLARIDAALKDFFREIEEEEKRLDEERRQRIKRTAEFFSTRFADAFTQFAQGTMTAADAFRSMILSMLNELSRLAAHQAFKALFSGFLGSAGGGGGFFGSILSGIGGLFGLQGGGPVKRNQPVLVGEAGPELFIPSGSGQVVPNERTPIGGQTAPINIVNNVTVDGSQGGTANQNKRLGNIIADAIDNRIKITMAEQMRVGGVLNRTQLGVI